MFALHTTALEVKAKKYFILFYRPKFAMKEIPEEDFMLHVQLTIDALSTGDLNILKDFQKIFVEIMGTEYFLSIIREATQQLEDVSPEIQGWIQEYLSHFY